MDQSLLPELKKSLLEEHNKLVAELRSLTNHSPRGEVRYPQFEPGEHGSHASLEEEADEVEEFEVRLATAQSLESRLLEITKALNRINKNTYGVCLKCGKDIEDERLRANPAAEFHTEHVE